MAMAHNHLVTGRWNDDACQKNHSFVCYRKKCRSTVLVLSALNIRHFRPKSLFTCRFNNIYPASTSASSIDPPPPTTSPCPSGYISWYHNCYKLVEQPATWDAAQADCRQQGGNLASIDMSYDQAFVAGVVLKGQDAWIGLRRKVLQRGWGH